MGRAGRMSLWCARNAVRAMHAAPHTARVHEGACGGEAAYGQSRPGLIRPGLDPEFHLSKWRQRRWPLLLVEGGRCLL